MYFHELIGYLDCCKTESCDAAHVVTLVVLEVGGSLCVCGGGMCVCIIYVCVYMCVYIHVHISSDTAHVVTLVVLEVGGSLCV